MCLLYKKFTLANFSGDALCARIKFFIFHYFSLKLSNRDRKQKPLNEVITNI